MAQLDTRLPRMTEDPICTNAICQTVQQRRRVGGTYFSHYVARMLRFISVSSMRAFCPMANLNEDLESQ